MDYVYLVKLFIISCLAGEGHAVVYLGYGRECDNKFYLCVEKRNLTCLNNICGCDVGYKQYPWGTWDRQDTCEPEVDYNGICRYGEPEYPSCKDEFICVGERAPRICRCRNLAQVFDGEQCIFEKLYGDSCNISGLPVCKSSQHLTCRGSETCDCNTQDWWFWSPGRGTCVQRPVHAERCASDLPCRNGAQWNLECDAVTAKCKCPSHLTLHPGQKCGPRAKLDEPCDPLPECERDSGWNLKCDKKCVCKDGLVEIDGNRCDVPGKLGQKCPMPVCDPKGSMDCVNNACACKANHVAKNGKCGFVIRGRSGGVTLRSSVPSTFLFIVPPLFKSLIFQFNSIR